MSQPLNLRTQLSDAAKLLSSAGPGAATAVIQKALRGYHHGNSEIHRAPSPFQRPQPTEYAKVLPEFVSGLLSQLGVAWSGDSVEEELPAKSPASPNLGQFLTKTYTNHAGSRKYKLYIPSSYRGQAMPLMVMLHGCTQNPDDFSVGTNMNAVAEEKGCFVVYPAQDQSANASKCWNWFQAKDQQRGQGEPSIIAGITNEVIEGYGLDRGKIYIAGLSAGGAMAMVMGTTYSDLYKAVGVHSGLPYASARDLPSAMRAMRGAPIRRPDHDKKSHKLNSIPVIVFHGDNDATVSPINGRQLIDDFVAGFERPMDSSGDRSSMDILVEDGNVPGGRSYTRTSHHVSDRPAVAEHWVIHGAGHAWAGGCSHGTYTDRNGPDASREMLRFFYTQS